MNNSLTSLHQNGTRPLFGWWGPAVGLAGPDRERSGDGELGARELGRDLGLLARTSWESTEVVLDDGGADAEAFQLGEEFLEHLGIPVWEGTTDVRDEARGITKRGLQETRAVTKHKLWAG